MLCAMQVLPLRVCNYYLIIMCSYASPDMINDGTIFYYIDGIVSSVGPQECFNLNTAGTAYGNCGHAAGDFEECSIR